MSLIKTIQQIFTLLFTESINKYSYFSDSKKIRIKNIINIIQSSHQSSHENLEDDDIDNKYSTEELINLMNLLVEFKPCINYLQDRAAFDQLEY